MRGLWSDNASRVIEYVLKDGRSQLRVGRVTVSQTTFLMVTAVIVGLGGGFGAVAFRALITGETFLAFNVIGASLGKVIGVFAIVVQLALGGIIAAWIASTFAPKPKDMACPK